MNHVHEELDKYGYCTTCDERVMLHFHGTPLPDRPVQEDIHINWTRDPLICDVCHRDVNVESHDGQCFWFGKDFTFYETKATGL
jgi:hypothetical protein